MLFIGKQIFFEIIKYGGVSLKIHVDYYLENNKNKNRKIDLLTSLSSKI